jgi:hypothetical protein
MNTQQPFKDYQTSLLDRVSTFLGRFIAYPSTDAQIAHTLWIFHTHLMDLWDSTPRIAFLSKEPGSGKSRALEVTELLVPKPIQSVNATPAYIFRKIGEEDDPPTLLYDEIDTVFGPKAKENEEIRGLLNAGHRRHLKAGRCVTQGKKIVTEELSAYCAVAFAGLGNLPDTILSRSIIIKMKRRKASEVVEPFRIRYQKEEGARLRDEMASWAEAIRTTQGDISWPTLPPEIQDRDQDIWESLILIADYESQAWGERARQAALRLTSHRDASTPSLGINLLADIRSAFNDELQLTTQELLCRLNALEDAPWGSFRGAPMNPRQLSVQLKEYDIHPKSIRFGYTTLKGYTKSSFEDAWSRYLSSVPQSVGTTETAGTAGTAAYYRHEDVTDVPLVSAETDYREE